SSQAICPLQRSASTTARSCRGGSRSPAGARSLRARGRPRRPRPVVPAGPLTLRQLRPYQLVSLPQQTFELRSLERVAEPLLLNPHRAREIRRGSHARTLDELRKVLGRGLERQLVRGLGVHCTEHLLADAENEILAPLDVFRRVRQRAAERSERFQRHFRSGANSSRMIASRTSSSTARVLRRGSRLDDTVVLNETM